MNHEERKNVLRLSNITMLFGGVVAVNDLSLEINEGEIVSIIGPNGAGKTTAFNVITGVYEPTNGEVDFLGKPIARNHPHGKMKKLYAGEDKDKYASKPKHGKTVVSLKPDAIAKRGIARTFQNIRLFPSMTVFVNVLVAKHMRKKSNLFTATFKLIAMGEKKMKEECLELL